jgi:mRNA interferase RelE/StbE
MKVITTNHAVRQLKKLPPTARQEAYEAIETLVDWPGVSGIKKLKSRPDYRLRVGRYRIVFEITDDSIYVTQVLIRDDSTY